MRCFMIKALLMIGEVKSGCWAYSGLSRLVLAIWARLSTRLVDAVPNVAKKRTARSLATSIPEPIPGKRRYCGRCILMFAYREPGRDRTARAALMFAAGYAAF